MKTILKKAPEKPVKKVKSAHLKPIKKVVKKVKSVPKDITEIAIDYKSACQVLKRKAELPDLSMLPEKHGKSITAYIVLTTIIEAWNEGWVADFSDHNQSKYYAYFWVKQKGACFGFSHSYYIYTYTTASSASRLCLNTPSKVLLAAKKFEQLYIDYLL